MSGLEGIDDLYDLLGELEAAERGDDLYDVLAALEADG